jgi:hypothetical protein
MRTLWPQPSSSLASYNPKQPISDAEQTHRLSLIGIDPSGIAAAESSLHTGGYAPRSGARSRLNRFTGVRAFALIPLQSLSSSLRFKYVSDRTNDAFEGFQIEYCLVNIQIQIWIMVGYPATVRAG